MKKVYKILTVFFIMITVMLMNVSGEVKVQATEQNVDVWDGGVDISWYDSSNIKTSYDILNAKQFAGLAQLVNAGEDFDGVILNLTTDIDLNNIEWTPIGGSNRFTGATFNGNGHTIMNLTVTADTNFFYGLFGWTQNVQLNNIIVKDGNIIANGGEVGMLVADMIGNSNVYQCYTSGTVVFTDGIADAVGGVVGQIYNDSDGSYASIKESGSSVSITSDQAGQYGGIIGWVSTYDNSLFEITDCYYAGKLTVSDPGAATNGIAGIAVSIIGYGFPDNPSGEYKIINCYVSGIVENTGDTTSALGIALVDGTVSNCYWNSALGIVGVQQMTWDKANAGFIQGTGQTTSTEEKSLEAFKSSDFLATLNNGGTTWGILNNNSEYPYPLLTWQLKAFAADYALVDQALGKVPADLSIYTVETTNALNNAIVGVIRGKDASEQSLVNSYATMIETAIQQLEYKPADYTKVNVATAKVPLDLNIYTDESVKELNNAINAVVQGKNITEQSIVDGYAKAIETAINQLKYKSADYTKVNEAISKVPSDLSIYTDTSVNELNKSLEAVEKGKNITEQEVVNGYATAIENAISNLKKKTIVVDGIDVDDNKKDNKVVKATSTDDRTNVSLLITMLIVSGGILILKYKSSSKGI
ncbi:hypothetical protein [Breznakia pachnodae]|uniref:GLUG domain-containing protein n=1 Tax=Breznakia pachnodae TaxID=265178 RepID=A0ABU0E6T3_9FIRM|nr:hypothetical protein [Breznakia pachnodae]MDQ0362531.1 hypothetical protein [Breznakia pachnodae]